MQARRTQNSSQKVSNYHLVWKKINSEPVRWLICDSGRHPKPVFYPKPKPSHPCPSALPRFIFTMANVFRTCLNTTFNVPTRAGMRGRGNDEFVPVHVVASFLPFSRWCNMTTNIQDATTFYDASSLDGDRFLILSDTAQQMPQKRLRVIGQEKRTSANGKEYPVLKLEDTDGNRFSAAAWQRDVRQCISEWGGNPSAWKWLEVKPNDAQTRYEIVPSVNQNDEMAVPVENIGGV